MAYVLMNDDFVSREAARVDIEDRGYQFGDGIYEVVRVHGGKLFKMDEHLSRFVRSTSEIGITLPFSVETIKDKLLQLFELDPLEDGMIYFQVTRGTAPRIHHFPEPSVPARLIAYTKTSARPAQLQQQGVQCVFAEDIRWLRCDIKSLNLLGNVMAKQQAKTAGAYEAILHRGEMVTEGSSTNVFIVNNETLYTHPANNFILNGITRMTILEMCAKLNIKVVESTFTTQDLLEADEVFISSTNIDAMPVIQVDGRPIGSGKPGALTKAIQREFEQLFNS
ncbi:D-alanine aminotransferase [Cohnella kolymensis]|uniref:D-alanine aminotransferase n=1 Tax=Cohnella kolymensis TaxID=1590652 RepID=A0ABR5A8X6_9BACL|nr:D-amino-acid transaminase [Cohnella kolymensis]KIL37468.1 D-alanine aminotransferase [Cohnella kolymensis]